MSSDAPDNGKQTPAALLACPVALLTAYADGKGWIMVGTAAYANLEPLMLTVSIRKQSETGQAILKCGRFGVSVASTAQCELTFALSRADLPSATAAGGDRFASLGVSPAHFQPTGTPYLPDAVVAFDLKVISQTRAGDHTIVVGLVEGTTIGIISEPLLRFNRTYGTFAGVAYQGDSYPV